MSILEFINDFYHAMYLIIHKPCLKIKICTGKQYKYALKYAHAVSYACLDYQINAWFCSFDLRFHIQTKL